MPQSKSLQSLLLACIGACVLTGCGNKGVSTSSGSTSSSSVQVTVSGTNQVRLGSTVQLSATVSNSSNQGVTWAVNGTAGGNSSVGTISSSGLYTPPAAIPNPSTVTITATSQASSSASGSLTESILNPVPVVTSVAATPGTTAGSYAVTVTGTGFVTGSQIQVNGQGITTTFVSSTQVTGTVTGIASGTTQISVDVSNPDPGTSVSAQMNAQLAQLSITAAARLLDQTTFGPTPGLIQHVQQVGINGWLQEQFNTSATKLPNIPTPPPTICATATYVCLESEWWQTALTGNDQLRQRVAFALGEIFVVSSDTDGGTAITPYANTLANDAFTNWYTIMKDVTLSPAMGIYLNMLNSAKPTGTNIANENYARENLQLFNTGLFLLNQDGSLQLDSSGNPQPAYTEAQVQAFARAYTGWTYANADGSTPTKLIYTANYFTPMVAVETQHDTTAKAVLDGVTIPAGQTAEQDVDSALTNIFNNANVPPFICKQLIQHLVTSTPSPAYVQRVASVFVDNGSHVRGDMKAVLTAIFTDQEARAGDTDSKADGGHLREPILWVTALMRGLGFTNTDANGSYYSLSNYTNSLGERPYRSGSVFNFFPPSYVIPGTTINAPEFGLENTASVVLRLSLADSIVNNKISGFTVDLSATSAFGQMASNPGNLVDALGALFLHAQMDSNMRTAIINQITPLTNMAQRVRVATYLVVTSSEYKILH